MNDLETSMRQREAYHSLQIPEGVFIVLRVDGRAFHSHVKKENYDRPYDEDMRDRMLTATKSLMEEFDGCLGYTQSDEISILLPLEFDMYNRSVEKLVSLSASIATRGYGVTKSPAFFDSRIIVLGGYFDVARYFFWRTLDAYRNFQSAVVYWQARELGYSKKKASELSNAPANERIVTLESWGKTVSDYPEWMKQGTYVKWVEYEKEGFNPITNENVTAKRRKLDSFSDLPHGHQKLYNRFYNLILSSR